MRRAADDVAVTVPHVEHAHSTLNIASAERTSVQPDRTYSDVQFLANATPQRSPTLRSEEPRNDAKNRSDATRTQLSG